MKAGKIGKSASDIFASTVQAVPAVPAAAPKPKAAAKPTTKQPKRTGRGRPPVHDEAWTKVTVVLMNRQIVFLDRLAADIRAKTGSAVSRAELIRAFIDAVSEAKVGLSTIGTEAELKAVLAERLS